MSDETNDLLRAIGMTLIRIEAVIVGRTVKRPASKRSRMGRMVAEAQESLATTAEQFAAKRVVELWAEICPDCPQPVAMDADRNRRAREFFGKMAGEDGVRNVFLTVAGNDWLCGRVTTRGRDPRRPVGLFEVIANVLPIVEGTFR